MTAKILKDTGWVVNRSTFRGLTQDKIDSPEEQAARVAFDEKVAKTFGDPATVSDFGVDFDIGEAQLYEDDEQQAQGAPDRDDVPDDFL